MQQAKGFLFVFKYCKESQQLNNGDILSDISIFKSHIETGTY